MKLPNSMSFWPISLTSGKIDSSFQASRTRIENRFQQIEYTTCHFSCVLYLRSIYWVVHSTTCSNGYHYFSIEHCQHSKQNLINFFLHAWKYLRITKCSRDGMFIFILCVRFESRAAQAHTTFNAFIDKWHSLSRNAYCMLNDWRSTDTLNRFEIEWVIWWFRFGRFYNQQISKCV